MSKNDFNLSDKADDAIIVKEATVYQLAHADCQSKSDTYTDMLFYTEIKQAVKGNFACVQTLYIRIA